MTCTHKSHKDYRDALEIADIMSAEIINDLMLARQRAARWAIALERGVTAPDVTPVDWVHELTGAQERAEYGRRAIVTAEVATNQHFDRGCPNLVAVAPETEAELREAWGK